MNKKHIIVCDHIHEKGIELLKNQSDISFEDLAHLPKDELLKHIHKANVLITRSSTSVDTKLLDAAFINGSNNLNAILRAGVGIDNVDINECSLRGVIVMNVPTANTIAAVELTITHMLNSIRRFPGANFQLKQEKIWNREDWYGTELKDKKLGIIGFGNIGSRVGIRAKAFEMDVITYDPYINPEKALDLGVKYTTNFEDILSSDIITIHTPKNSETINMISFDEIKKMKQGVILINCARGGLYNEDALYEGLKSKKIAFSGIDVFSKEPATSNKLLELDNIYVTPHIGANTLESQEKIAIQAALGAISASKGSSFPNALNLPVQTSHASQMLKGYLELSQKLGFFCAQIIKGAISKISLEVCGSELQDDKESIFTFALLGSLKHSLGEKINFVNVNAVAKNLEITTEILSKLSASPYKNTLTICIITNKESISVTGTVYDNSLIRFSNINGYSMDVEPKGNMILVRNTDVPGVIGDIGNAIAKHSVNIADFRLGRSSDKKEALALILVDSNPPKDLIDDLLKIKECTSIKSVSM